MICTPKVSNFWGACHFFGCFDFFLFYRSNSSVILLETLQAISSILLAALAASRRVGLFRGIAKIATAPAAAPKPTAMASPFMCIRSPPFKNSIPNCQKITIGKVSHLCSDEKVCYNIKNGKNGGI